VQLNRQRGAERIEPLGIVHRHDRVRAHALDRHELAPVGARSGDQVS